MTRTTELAPGTELDGTYRIVEQLGEGGMGAVYVAELVRLPKRVALKVLHGAADEAARARFRREAEIAAKVRHPRVVEVLDYNFLEDGSPYLVMELLEGHDLRHRLSAGPLPRDEVVAILSDTASALERLHELGIVHRDLKPENIFLAREGDEVRAKVLDFGISKVLGSSTALTADRSVLGTPAYMAPEQVTGENTVLDPRTDQFALAAVAYEMLAGQPAFQADTVIQLFHRILTEPPPPVTGEQRRRDPVDEVLAKALAKSRDDRYPSVRAFVSALASALGVETAQGRTPTPAGIDPMAQTVASGELPPAQAQAPSQAHSHRGSRRNLLLALGGGLAVFGLAAALIAMRAGGEEQASGEEAPGVEAEGEGAGAETGSGTETGTATGIETGSGTETGAGTGDEAEAGTGSGTENGTENGAENGAETEVEDGTGAGDQAAAETEAANEPGRARGKGQARGGGRAASRASGRPGDPEALAELEAAEASLASGDAQAAIRHARRSLQQERSMAARAALAKAHCAKRDLGLARAMARGLRGQALRDVKRYCREQSIRL